ncbi:MAG: L-seryl-tRNA(Sec) selenium transferase [Actinobacteria bacterium]|nr:MAG: L-seryl-tRNA(Sec) selenium transferase [Actinomycetota bacterium]RIK04889.1 MAG: L-seryl-tRNA(Sec) selenium transferase [Acidobacteriota bacterium]
MRPPSVDSLARSLSDTGLPHPLLVEVAREAIAADRVSEAHALAAVRRRRLLVPVVNATGVLLHTNLGRAPLCHVPPLTYTNLELDLETGKRGSRQERTASLLAAATGAESAMVVNNCAAAVLLVLAALARGRPVAVSRSELVEIGGGFRVPEVMAQSGARLLEVGTTNRTRRDDFGRAVAEHDPALLLKVHQSNYRIVGFTESVPVRDMSGFGRPVIVDLGSGLLDASTPWLDGPPPSWLRGEPAVRQTLAEGAALVTFSGDKLLGGPQAGIIAGRADLVDACADHPLARAVRPGELVVAALQETLLAYLRRDAAAIPLWAMASARPEDLRARAARLGGGKVIETEALPGGGTLPGVTIPSVGVAFAGDLTEQLRAHCPPILARVIDDRTVLDLRTVLPADDEVIAEWIAQRP